MHTGRRPPNAVISYYYLTDNMLHYMYFQIAWFDITRWFSALLRITASQELADLHDLQEEILKLERRCETLMGECKGMKEQYWARLRECTYCMYIFTYIYIYTFFFATSRFIKHYISI